MKPKILKDQAKIEHLSARVWACCLAPVMHPDQAQIGKMMRGSREGQNVSLREVARRMKLSAPYLSDLELGRRGWTQARVLQCMEAIYK